MNDADAQNLAAATYPILPAQDAADLHARSDLEFGDHRFRLSPDCELERDAVRALLQQLATHVDLAEPFGRIHEAIREAQRISEQEFDADARAA